MCAQSDGCHESRLINHWLRLRLTRFLLWECDPVQFQVGVRWRCWTHRRTGWCWCASGPKWRPAWAHSCQCSENTWSAAVSHTAPPWSADHRTHRLDRPLSSQGNCGSPAPGTKEVVEGSKQHSGHDVLPFLLITVKCFTGLFRGSLKI